MDGGALEDVTITNLAMTDIVNSPIFLRIGSRLRGPAGVQPAKFRRVSISHVVAHGVTAEQGILIAGLPGHPISDVSLSDVVIDFAGGGAPERSLREVPELERGYPEPGSFGVLPAYGLYARHAADVSLDNVRFHVESEDRRPALLLDDVDVCDLSHVSAEEPADVPVLVGRSVTHFRADASPGLAPMP